MSLSRFTYIILFSPGILFGAWTTYKLWKTLGRLDDPWRYRRRFLRIFLFTMLIAWCMDYLLIYFEAWTFPENTHLWNLPVWPAQTFYGHPMVIPFEEFFLFNTMITWFIAYLLMFQFTVSNDIDLRMKLVGASERTEFKLEIDGKTLITYSEPFWVIRLARWLRRIFKP